MSYFDKDTPDIVLRSLFSKYDTDGSGRLAGNEIKIMLQDDMGWSADEAETSVLLSDADGSGKISFEEFRSWLHSGDGRKNIDDKSRYGLVRAAVDMFKKYDADESGCLDKSEFARVLVDCGGRLPDLDCALNSLDLDHNGKISFTEFLKWLNWIPM